MDAETKVAAKRAWLARAGHALIEASENEGCGMLLVRWLRFLTLWTTLLYIAVLVGLTLVSSWVGERNPTTAFLLFLPPAIWWLPALPLALMTLCLHRRALCLLALTMAWFGYDFLGWRWNLSGHEREGGNDALIVMTNNHGQHMNQSLQPFKNATQPDVIVLQESPGKASSYERSGNYAEFPFMQSVREHTILSRYPILESSALASLPGQSPKAVRFVIDWKGKQVALYSVHLHSPRETLAYQKWGPFLYGILGLPGTPWAEKRQRLQQFWNGQIADAEIVLAAIRQDSLPVIAAGDFNAPHIGYIHRMITRQLKDSHAEAGQGFGLTFPGFTNNPLSAGGPWMRIDYVFYDRHWEAIQCVTEPDRPSQHRALAATLVLKDLERSPD
ncbi:Uncharacterized conserved protein YafD, endonuclease/exonuclease/phosphatase (EEP) superfamily [Prosthecobacter debontii]|uniref:Uncharacterized conserved protein YafD, endonuclease/exonuclease/phosphatase (EEP) superfamily n=2 Tax=Prosthecobacter debontii TaxID=48467 RepID=A0A1T4X475_9BACT|nr:Uncharacterized conserved protein YafD, endonuclease/exonuclease/phosphatase (EEP) superfamily [Prosthecobacter debontii]